MNTLGFGRHLGGRLFDPAQGIRHDRIMTDERYDELLEEIVEDELHRYYAAVVGVENADELDRG